MVHGGGVGGGFGIAPEERNVGGGAFDFGTQHICEHGNCDPSDTPVTAGSTGGMTMTI